MHNEVWTCVRLFHLFLLIVRPLNNQNHGNLFLKTRCHIQLSSGQDESILAVESQDLDDSSLLVSIKLDSTIIITLSGIVAHFAG